MDQWQVLIHNQLPAYISWEQFLANQGRLKRNRAGFDTPGAPREGSALLGGLVRCGKCGWRMYVAYTNKDAGRYVCRRNAALAGHCEGQNFVARVLDDLVSGQVLLAIEPAALDLSLRVQDDLHREQERLAEHWQQKLERARYETERLRRQYDAVEPENRLVARELERSWEEALSEEQKVKEERARFQAEWSEGLSTHDRERIRALSADIPALWNSSSTTNQDRQVIIRQLIEHVTVTVQGNSEIVDVTVHWAGTFVSRHQIIRPVGRYEQLRDYDRLVTRLSELRATGHTNRDIAHLLNDEGFHTPKCGQRFDAPLVQRLTSRCALPTRQKDDANARNGLEEHEWGMPDLAREVGVPYSTIRNWCYRGWICTHVIAWKGRRRVLWADEDEIDRLRRLRDHPHPSPDAPYPSELTTSKRSSKRC